ncbi:PAS domain-containing sensor histidine kinase [Fodinicurvata sp. EGI_FJ10296]|uniref:sensor histidine kinase NtrY-like n=1 Tax=Fodinicurvata sp. EGI_FJ10296 TaxID=3231908 RepID=UPI003453D9D2
MASGADTDKRIPQGHSLRLAWRDLVRWSSRLGLGNKFALALMVAAVLAGLATYAALTEGTSLNRDTDTINFLLNLDLFILLLLGAVIARRVAILWGQRRQGLAGSRLHVRVVALFSVVAVAPAILMATFSLLFFHAGLQSWFSDRVSTAVNESLSVAQAYLEEHQQTLRADALSMANDINREAERLAVDSAFFNQFVTTQAILRNLTEALVFDSSGETLARSNLTFALQFEPIPEDILSDARNGDVRLMPTDSDDRVRALIRLDRFDDAFLLVGRLVEASVIGHMERAETAVAEYRELEGRRSTLQITFTLIYAVVSLLLLMVAVWLALVFADRLVAPVSALIVAAERVRSGDLAARVTPTASGDELSDLGRAFNRMTSQLESQRSELIEANRQLDHRRRFTETVLSGVSAGVLGVDEGGVVNLPNRSATELLGLDLENILGARLTDIVPEIDDLLATARRQNRLAEGNIRIYRNGELRTLLVRIAAERLDGRVRGYVVTFDDITELLAAQRKAAWADVARRIAHEIKNPLTPIQLSAERLKRRYLRQIDNDPETFSRCIETIVRHVGDIGRMVDEFSSFARMPAPVIEPIDIVDLTGQAAFLQKTARPDINFETETEEDAVIVACDGRQISQAMTNLLQNAIDAIDARLEQQSEGEAIVPRIRIRVDDAGDAITVSFIDNGRGLPTDERDRLTEPYVTTRDKGTGLGLAIVKKIMEDHGGRLVLEDNSEEKGAIVRMVFPKIETPAPAREIDPQGPEGENDGPTRTGPDSDDD